MKAHEGGAMRGAEGDDVDGYEQRGRARWGGDGEDARRFRQW